MHCKQIRYKIIDAIIFQGVDSLIKRTNQIQTYILIIYFIVVTWHYFVKTIERPRPLSLTLPNQIYAKTSWSIKTPFHWNRKSRLSMNEWNVSLMLFFEVVNRFNGSKEKKNVNYTKNYLWIHIRLTLLDYIMEKHWQFSGWTIFGSYILTHILMLRCVIYCWSKYIKWMVSQ